MINICIARQFLWGIKSGIRSFPKYHREVLLGDFNSKLGREDIFKPTIGNDSLHQDSNANGHIINFVTSKNPASTPKSL